VKGTDNVGTLGGSNNKRCVVGTEAARNMHKWAIGPGAAPNWEEGMSKKIVVRIADERRQALRVRAAEVGLTASALIRIAINRLLEDRGAVTLPASHDRRAA